MSEIRVLTLNIRLGLDSSLEEIADLISRHQPDLVSLQEVGRRWTYGRGEDQPACFSQALGMDAFFCQTLEDGAGAFGHLLLYKGRLGEVGEIDLPQARDERRRALLARWCFKEHEIDVLSTHLSHLDDERAKQHGALFDLVDGMEAPSIILGDLNEPSPEKLVEELKGRSGCKDPGALAGVQTFPATAPEDRRDLILGIGLRSLEHRVLKEVVSDHLAVFSRWSLEF